MSKLKSIWPDIRRGLYWINKILPAVAVMLGIVSVFILASLLNRQHQSNLESCSRGNDSRVATVKNLRGDVHTLKAQLKLWDAALANTTPQAKAKSPEPVLKAFTNNVEALEDGIAEKQASVRRTIHAQAPVAIHPHSAVVDCAKAYP